MTKQKITLRMILEAIEKKAPRQLQEGYDNSGIQFGNPDKEVTKGLICLDVTESIVDEAIANNCDLIISHHPLLFGGVKSLSGKNYVERTLIKAVKADIAIISSHTNLDSVMSGVNGKLAEKLGLNNLVILAPKKGVLRKLVVFCPLEQAEFVRQAIFDAGAGHIGDYDCCSYNIEGKGTFRAGENSNPFVGEKGQVHQEDEVRIETILPEWLSGKVVLAMLAAHPYEEVAYDIYPLENDYAITGMGMVGNLPEPLSESEFLTMVKRNLGIQCIRHNPLTGRKIQKVAVCGGSGSFLRHKAVTSNADAFITADIKYHEFFDVENKMLMADVGHYESEQFTTEILYEIVTENFTNFALLISSQSTNPVRYF
jgi:dinuclear metal center YbgI/SA1388 family protein